MTNDIRILSVLRKYYEEKALSTNSQEDADIHNALLHAIKALESSISIPSGATNGDVIKAVFPNAISPYMLKGGSIYRRTGDEYIITSEFWNAPYREGDNDAEH